MLSIYNMRGQQLQRYSLGTQNAGTYELTWDARDQYGSDVSSGVYLYHIQAGDQAITQQFTLLK
jgi:flagellar hook assembly protein FlgD